MKILFMTSRDITHPKWAGGDVYHFEVARRLARKGHIVAMLCSKYPKSKNCEEIEGIKIIRIKGGVFRILSNFITYSKALKGKYNVVIEEAEGPSGPLFAFLYAKEPVVIMWHQLGKTIYSNQFPYLIALTLLALERLYVALARKYQIMVPSQERAKEFLTVGVSKDNINVVPAAFSIQPSKKKNNGSPREPYFLILGKIRRYKAYHHAIDALKILDQNARCLLIIAGRRGEDRYYAELNNLIAEYGLQNRVYVKLNISEEEKRQLLSNAVALIVTSPIEGFSIVSAEANALGIPVIATDGVPEEVIKDRFNGLKYKFGDVKALAEKMDKLMIDEKLREELSKNAIKNVSKFSWDRSARLFEETLEKTVKKDLSNW